MTLTMARATRRRAAGNRALPAVEGTATHHQALLDPAQHQQLRIVHNSDSLDDIAAFFAEVRRFRLLKMAREARRLLTG